MAKKLLVVDSNLAVQKLVEYNLSREKFEVTCLNDGLSALDLLAKINPDLILADYHLEGISFNRFCEKVRQKQSEKERPILVLVGPSDSYDPNKLLSLGVVDFVKKPLEPRVLIEKLKELSQEAATMIDTAPKPAADAPPAPSPSATADMLPHPTVKDQAEAMKIEELLGWSLPGEKQADDSMQKTEKPGPDQDNEMTIVQSRADVSTLQSVIHPESSKDLPAAPTPGPMPAIGPAEQKTTPEPIPSPSASAPHEAIAPATAAEMPEVPSTPITEATLEAAFPHLYASPESVETPPTVNAPQPSPGVVSPEMAQEMISKIAKEIIEKVAWDVVPSLAEILIKEELEKLKTDKPA
jgi:DNA-binding response OmpR family regulator